MRRLIIIILSILLAYTSYAQILVTGGGEPMLEDSVKRDFSNQPYFGMYKDNYFIFGPSVGPKPTKENTNIKFQISIAQRLTQATLPWGTYLYLFYTQKCFWNILENSMPMTDLNFNPGIGLVKLLFVKNRFIGKLIMLLEHESNGRDGTESRSWNKISFDANIMIDPNFMVHGKFWIPIVDGVENKDILDYCGTYQVGTQIFSTDRRWGASVTLVKRKGWKLNYNTILEFNYRLFKRDNQYLFLQYYNGYGEGLLDYKQFHSMLRIGLVIKPQIFSDY